MWIPARIKYCGRKRKRHLRANECYPGKQNSLYTCQAYPLLGSGFCSAHHQLFCCLAILRISSCRQFCNPVCILKPVCAGHIRFRAGGIQLCKHDTTSHFYDFLFCTDVYIYERPVHPCCQHARMGTGHQCIQSPEIHHHGIQVGVPQGQHSSRPACTLCCTIGLCHLL